MTGRSRPSACGSWSSRADLQETVWGDGYDQASDLLGPDYELARHASRSADGVGAVLASRWPFGNIREVDLHVTERVDDLPWAAAVTAEVLLPEPLGLTLFAHHKPTYQLGYARERELQAVASARFVETQVAGRDLHVVLLGDLDDPHSAGASTTCSYAAVTRTITADR
jgi:hypothetical protein